MGRIASSSRIWHLLPRVIGAIARRPELWIIAIRQVRVLAAPGWWKRVPFLPLPAPDYLRFRLQTAYGGDGTGPIHADDVVTYLQWCRSWRALH